jgi:hypothetical protein
MLFVRDSECQMKVGVGVSVMVDQGHDDILAKDKWLSMREEDRSQ